MTAYTTTSAYQLDLAAPALNSDPYQTYARLRANRGVHYWSAAPDQRFPVLSRYADVRLALRDPRLSTVLHDHTHAPRPDSRRLSTLDADHVSRLLRSLTTTLMDDLARRGAFDLISDYAVPLATRLAGELTRLTCVDDFENGPAMTVDLIGNATFALLSHRDQLARLRASPERIRAAVDELLRFDSPLQSTERTALTDVELPEGDVIEAGELVTVLIGAANRDYSQFAEPDRLDLDRSNANRHLAFGVGAHACAGAALARLEAEIGLSCLIQRLPRLRLAEEQPAWRRVSGRRGLEALRVSAF
jgi:cytochrome P450